MRAPEAVKNTESSTFPISDSVDALESPRKYRDNALDGFRNGAQIDLRARVALAMLEHSPALQGAALSMTPVQVANFALDAATEVLALAETRGLIDAFKSLDQDPHLKKHIHRQVAFQGEMGKEQMRVQREVGGVVQTPGRPN